MSFPDKDCDCPKGSLSINETVLPISDIYLSKGEIVFVGRAQGPLAASTSTSCTVFDSKGHVVTHGVDLAPITWPDVPAGKWIEVHMPLILSGRSGPKTVSSEHPYHRRKTAEEKLFGVPFEVNRTTD